MALPSLNTRHFVRDLILVFLLLTALVIGAVAFFSARSRQDISQKYIENSAQSAVRQFAGMAESMDRTLKLVDEWIASGRLSLTDMDGLNALLFPVLTQEQVLFGISVADTQGDNYYLTAHGDGWRTSVTRTVGDRRRTVIRFYDAGRNQVDEKEKPATYDPRSRPWFVPALSRPGSYWTPPYTFFESKVVGITASIARKTDAGRNQTVVAFDILLDDLFQAIQRMGPSENSRVFIVRNDTQLYVTGTDSKTSDFLPLDQARDLLARDMIAAWQDGGKAIDKAFSIQHEKMTWWCGGRPMQGANAKLWVGIMVPETDIIGNVRQRQAGLWMVGAAVVLLAGGLVAWLVRRYRQAIDPPDDRFDIRDPEASIRHLIAKGEGRSIEFKSTMRMNLHTQKFGKEIEIAWLKAVAGFMNTDGGTLLIGVNDDGDITGLAPDRFASDDKCRLHFKNLISQHIGAEFSKYLRFALIDVAEKRVGVVSCSRCAEPVYLKTPKSEEFYIRNGPSSDALPVSKVVAYIQGRQ